LILGLAKSPMGGKIPGRSYAYPETHSFGPTAHVSANSAGILAARARDPDRSTAERDQQFLKLFSHLKISDGAVEPEEG
jgi:hypothetical protein